MSDNEAAPVEAPEVQEPETNDPPPGNEPVEEQEQSPEEETEGDSPKKDSEENKPAVSSKRLRFKIGDAEKEYDEDEIVRTLSEREQYRESKKLNDTAKYILGQLGSNLKGTTLDILTGKLGSKEAARKELLKLADEIVTEEFRLASMPEGERRALDLQGELDANKKELAEFKRDREERESALADQKKINQYLGDVNGAIKEVKGLEDDPLAYQDIANAYVACREEGHDVTAKEVAEMVLADRKKKEQAWEEAQVSDPSRFAKKYKSLVEKLREFDLNQIREDRSKAKTPHRAEPKTRADVSKRRIVTSSELADIMHKF